MSSQGRSSSISGGMDEDNSGDVHSQQNFSEIFDGAVEQDTRPTTSEMSVIYQTSHSNPENISNENEQASVFATIHNASTLGLSRVEDIVNRLPAKKTNEKNNSTFKKRRNSEQRTPKKNTLLNYFPVVVQSPRKKVTSPLVPFSIPVRQDRESTQSHQKMPITITQSAYKTRSNSISNNDRPPISPGGNWNPQRGRNYMGTKTSRTILMDFNSEQTPKSRQSVSYTYEDWNARSPEKSLTEGFFGHNMDIIDNSMVFRILLQNPNGINPDPHNQDFQLSFSACYDHCISLIGLTETNVEWGHFQQRDKLQKSVKKWWDGARIQTSTSTVKFTGRYKPGGTALMVCGSHWAARVTLTGEDEAGMGRYSYIGVQGNKHTKVLNILYYRVCEQNKEAVGEKTAYMQQYNILRERFPNCSCIDPRKQSVLDMQLFITEKVLEGWLVILLTDSNENLLSTRGGWCPVTRATELHASPSKEHDGSFLTLVKTCGLVDVLQYQHPCDKYPPTYSRGKNRIDGIFVSPQILHSVLRTGIAPLHTFFQGDHRAVFADFSANLLFGSNTHTMTRERGRGLRLKDPRIVSQYVEKLYEQLAYHKILEKVRKLGSKPSSLWMQRDVMAYEKLDTLITESVLAAEHFVTRRYSTQYQWSPKLIQAVYVLRYARLRLKILKGINVSEKTLDYHRQRANLKIDQVNLTNMDQVVSFLRSALKTLKDLQSQHVELRKSYQEELAEALVFKRFPTAEEGTSFFHDQKSKQIKALINRESARIMHCRIRKALNKERGGGLSCLDIPDTTYLISPEGISYGNPEEPKEWKGGWKRITDPEEMVQYIIQMNIKQYHQAFVTPFGQEPLSSLFGPDGTTEFALSFLQQDTLPRTLTSQLQPETIRILQVLQQPLQKLYSGKMEITPAQYVSCYKKVPEAKQSSYSERHNGHYKVAVDHPALAEMYSTMMTLPWTKAFVPERWKFLVDVMLPKDEGSYYCHRMRIIRLCESDFNQALKILFARPLGHFLEDNDMYPDMQYGSRDGQMCISPVLNKQLTFDIARLQRSTMSTVEFDAIGCYDCIIQVLPSLFLQRMGISLLAIITICRAFDEAIHYVKTVYGVSSSTYTSTRDKPLYGAGQGTTVGPFFWLLVFKLIYEAFDPSLRGMHFISTCWRIESKRYGEAFVDDTKFGVTSVVPSGSFEVSEEAIIEQEHQIMSDTKALAQQYEKLLTATGGAINLKKSHWVLLTWRWKQGKAYLARKDATPFQLNLTSGLSTVEEEVPRLEPSDGYRTLGIHIAVNGKMLKALKLNRQHSEVFAGHLSTSALSQSEAYFAYTLYFYPKISYGLPVSTFTERECRYIQAPAMATFLSKIKLNRHTSKSIIHGPVDYGGLQLPDVYASQGIGALRLFLGHMRRQDTTSKLLEIAMSYQQLRTGSKTLFFNLPYPKYAKWVEHSWLTSLWQFLNRAKLTIQVPLSLPVEMREKDIFLMTEFVYMNFTQRELELINQCRLYHQVVTLADIATADGSFIDPNYMKGIRYMDRVSALRWPNQCRPSPEAWRIWKRALLHLQVKGKLREPLGRWIARPHQYWHWRYCTSDRRLFHLQANQWRSFRPLTARGRTRESQRPWYSLESARRCLPPEGTLAVATPLFNVEDGDLFSINWSEAFLSRTRPREEAEALSDLEDLEDLPQVLQYVPKFLEAVYSSVYYRRLVGPLIPPSEEALVILAECLQQGGLLACSDGSASRGEGTGSHAWAFSTKEGVILLQGAGPIDCHPDLLSSYRTELGGLLALLYLLQVLVSLYEITSGAITIYCDNKSALDNVFDAFPKRGIYPLLEADYDLLKLAKDILHSLPVKIHGRWVKGHYTGNNREVQHDLNALVDYLADQFRRNPPAGYEPGTTPYPHPSHRAIVLTDGSAITSKLPYIVYRNLYSDQLRETMCKRNKWTGQQFQSVDWIAFRTAFKTFTKFRQINITKMVHRLWHTGAQKRLFKIDPEGKCPCCHSVIETTSHVYQCQAPQVIDFRERKLQQFDDFLAEQQFSRTIKENLSAGIRQWILSGETHPSLQSPTRGKVAPLEQVATKAFVEQTSLGWESFLNGHLTIYWRRALLFGSSTGDVDEIESVLRNIIKKVFALSLSLWDCRNGILHGTTYAEQREKKSATIRAKVIEAYALFAENPHLILQQDRYLFSKKDLATRLKGDDDALLCWLRTVEVAMTTLERQQTRDRRQSEKFFAAFRSLGRAKRAAQIRGPDNDAFDHDSLVIEPVATIGPSLWHQNLEEVQLSSEVSMTTAQTYRTRKDRQQPVEGLTDTILEAQMSPVIPEGQMVEDGSPWTSDSSVASPSTFFRPIIYQDYSSDSSYFPSGQRDVPLRCDSDQLSNASSHSLNSYRRASFFQRVAKIEAAFNETLDSETDVSSSSSNQSLARRVEGLTGGASYSDSMSATSSAAEMPFVPSASPVDCNPISEVDAMRKYLQERNKGCSSRAQVTHAPSTQSDTIDSTSQDPAKTPLGWDNADMLEPPHGVPFGRSTFQVYQEISFAPYVDMPPFPLAQSSIYSSVSSGSSVSTSRDSRIVRASSMSAPDNSTTTSLVSSTREEEDSSEDTLEDFWRLEILPTPASGGSSTSNGGSLSGFQARSLNISPPGSSSPTSANSSIPPLTVDDNSVDLSSGSSTISGNLTSQQPTTPTQLFNVQGSAMAPALYVALQSQLYQLEQDLISAQGEAETSTTSALPSFSSGGAHRESVLDNLTQSRQEVADDASGVLEDIQVYNGVQTRITDFVEGRHLDGETAVSSGSPLYSVNVRRVEGDFGTLQLEGYILEIPVRELDDPPDIDGMEAASLDSASEIEQYRRSRV